MGRTRLLLGSFAFQALVLTYLLAAADAGAQIKINELLPNPVGPTDVGTERIEIYNAGATPIDVTGWAIDDAATFNDPRSAAGFCRKTSIPRRALEQSDPPAGEFA
jgi:hypothetical protein